jgi:hypothetical protein
LQTRGDGGGGTQVAEYFRLLYFSSANFFLPAGITSSAGNFHLAAVLLLSENIFWLAVADSMVVLEWRSLSVD